MRLHPRFLVAGLFVAVLVCAERNIPQLAGVRTEEGQRVAFNRGTWQDRELAKRLPPEEGWPALPDRARTLERFGLNRNAPPRSLPSPSRILRDVYLVGQERLTNLTYMIDCGPEGVALIDPSMDSEFDRTLDNVEACGRSRKDIRWVINTHCHTDHSLSDRKFHELGAQILIHEADAAAIEKGTLVTLFGRYKLAEFPKCPVDRRLSDGEELRLGNKVLLVIHTPGHTPGSASFLLQIDGKNVLLSGDTVFYDSMLGFQQHPYADNRQYLASVKKLEHFTINEAPVRWDLLLPGHGAIALDRAWLDVQKARERIEHDLEAGRELLTPRNTPEYRQKMYGRPATEYAP